MKTDGVGGRSSDNYVSGRNGVPSLQQNSGLGYSSVTNTVGEEPNQDIASQAAHEGGFIETVDKSLFSRACEIGKGCIAFMKSILSGLANIFMSESAGKSEPEQNVGSVQGNNAQRVVTNLIKGEELTRIRKEMRVTMGQLKELMRPQNKDIHRKKIKNQLSIADKKSILASKKTRIEEKKKLTQKLNELTTRAKQLGEEIK